MRILIAVAHADDETLGCFSLLKGHQVRILHCTDSTPLHPRYAQKAGFASVADYEVARRAEMLDALAVAGLDIGCWTQLAISDQAAPGNVAVIRETAIQMQADRIYTHAYEGGHPDHDALAFALRGLPNVWEFPLYHASETGEFVPSRFVGGEASVAVALTLGQQQEKRRMLNCFRSQQQVIQRFPIDQELFRPMREYDFSKPPHAGPLYYEIRQHGWTWSEWRKACAD